MQRHVLIEGGRALNELGGIPVYQPLSNSEYHSTERGSETAGDKLRRQKGKNPERQLRSQNQCSVENDVETLRQPGGWLRSSHPLKKA